MKGIKPCLALVLVVLLVTTFFVQAQESDVIVLNGVWIPANKASEKLTILPVGSSLETLVLPERVGCTMTGQPEWKIYDCPVKWEDVTVLDTSKPGRLTIHGTLQPETGYALAPEMSDQATASVMLEAPDMEPETLSEIIFTSYETWLLPVGGDSRTLSLSSTRALCYTNTFGEYLSCPVQWDLTAIDVSEPGTYLVPGTPILPPSFSAPADFTGVTARVGVVLTDCIDLSAVTITNEEAITCEWLFEAETGADVCSLEYAINDGEWLPDPGTERGGWYYGYMRPQSLTINLWTLTPDTDYAFRLLYKGQPTNSVSVRLEGDFVYAGGGIGGDPDGGDRGDQTLPPLEQPVPQPTTPPTTATNTDMPPTEGRPSEPAPPLMEQVTSTATILSGARLQQLLTVNRDTVLFEKQGIAVELPSAFLRDLQVAEDALLEVSVSRAAENGFCLSVTADGETITLLPDTTVRFPFTGIQTNALVLTDGEGQTVGDAVYDTLLGLVRVHIQHTGTYQLTERHVETIPNTGAATVYTGTTAPAASRYWIWAGVTAAVLLIGAGTAFIFYRRRDCNGKA